jgi:hypothetical protein
MCMQPCLWTAASYLVMGSQLLDQVVVDKDTQGVGLRTMPEQVQ